LWRWRERARAETPQVYRFDPTSSAHLHRRQQQQRARELQQIWMAETKAEAIKAFDLFEKTYAVKYEKAVACLTKDRDMLLQFYDFPAEELCAKVGDGVKG